MFSNTFEIVSAVADKVMLSLLLLKVLLSSPLPLPPKIISPSPAFASSSAENNVAFAVRVVFASAAGGIFIAFASAANKGIVVAFASAAEGIVVADGGVIIFFVSVARDIVASAFAAGNIIAFVGILLPSPLLLGILLPSPLLLLGILLLPLLLGVSLLKRFDQFSGLINSWNFLRCCSLVLRSDIVL